MERTYKVIIDGETIYKGTNREMYNYYVFNSQVYVNHEIGIRIDKETNTQTLILTKLEECD